MFSRMPLRVSVPLIFLSPVLLVAVVLSTISYVQSHATARDLTRRHLEQIHQRIDAHVDRLLAAPGQINAINRSLIEQGKLPLDDLPAWRETITAQLRAEPILSSVAFGDSEGRATWICRYVGDEKHIYYAINPAGDATTMSEYRVDGEGNLPAEPTSRFTYDGRTRPWYRAPAEAGRAAWCEPFLFVGGADAEAVTLGISYGEPLYDGDGELRGIIDADLSLNDISHYLEQLRIGTSGHVYIVDHRGLIIGSSMSAALADEQGQRVAVGGSDHPWVRSSAAQLSRAIDSFAELEQTHVRTIDIDGQPTLLMASPYEHATGISWVIVTLIPESDFLTGVYAARRRSLVIAVIASALTLVVGLVASRLMVRPMMRLTEHCRKIGEGELDREIELTESPELVRLSNEINEMSAGLRDRMRMRHSLAVAMDVQQALLPDGSPQVEGLDISGHSTYCDETGGDYYDFLDITGLGERSVCVALGDVMGHGVAAAMLMATARGILRSHSQEPRSLADLLGHMNSLLVSDTGGERFMTMLLATLDAEQRVLRWASAGHEPPFYYDPASGEYQELDGAGLPLGIVAEEVYDEHEFANIRSGQIFFMATDGVWEMQGRDGKQFGKQRIRELIEKHHAESAEAISERIHDALYTFRGDNSQDDDVTFVIVRVI